MCEDKTMFNFIHPTRQVDTIKMNQVVALSPRVLCKRCFIGHQNTFKKTSNDNYILTGFFIYLCCYSNSIHFIGVRKRTRVSDIDPVWYASSNDSQIRNIDSTSHVKRV